MNAAVVGDKYEVIFRVQGHSMWMRQQRVFALEKPDGSVFRRSGLFECYHCAVMLHREQYLLALFIDGDAEGSMRSVHFTYGAYISFGLAGKDH